MLDSQVLSFAAVAALLTVTPGADTLLVIRSTIRRGRTSGWITMLGILSGLLLHAVLSAAGLSVILMKSATAFQAVKLLGAGYLIWLGVRALWMARPISHEPAGDTSPPSMMPATGHRSAFLEGLLTNILNPKVALFYLAFLPQFVSPGDPMLAKSILLAVIHAAEGVLWLGGLTIVVARSRTLFAKPRVEVWVQRITGVVLAGLGIRLALSER